MALVAKQTPVGPAKHLYKLAYELLEKQFCPEGYAFHIEVSPIPSTATLTLCVSLIGPEGPVAERSIITGVLEVSVREVTDPTVESSFSLYMRLQRTAASLVAKAASIALKARGQSMKAWFIRADLGNMTQTTYPTLKED